ncbi:MAG: hypothetical protein AAGJ81_05640 [Verrucomicrobiota bacterium]
MKKYFAVFATLSSSLPLFGDISDAFGKWMTNADRIRTINESAFNEIPAGFFEQIEEEPVFLEIRDGFLSTSTKARTIRETYQVHDGSKANVFDLNYVEENGEVGERGTTIEIQSNNEILLKNEGVPTLVFYRIFPTSPSPRAELLSSFETKNFRLTMLSDMGYAKTVAAISWMKPDRRAMVVYDLDDGFPVMLAVDGTILFYNVVGGNILQIRADPEAKAIRLEDIARFQIGMRGDFPDSDSRNIFEFDLGAVFKAYTASSSNDLFFIKENQSYQFLSEEAFATLKVSDLGVPELFFLRVQPQGLPFFFSIKNVEMSTVLPSWHKPLNINLFSSRLEVIPVRQKWRLSENDRKVQRLIQGGAMWVIRRSLIDPALENGLKTNSPIRLDFEQMRENDEAMREKWLEAVQEQGLLWNQVLGSSDPDNPAKAIDSAPSTPSEEPTGAKPEEQ